MLRVGCGACWNRNLVKRRAPWMDADAPHTLLVYLPVDQSAAEKHSHFIVYVGRLGLILLTRMQYEGPRRKWLRWGWDPRTPTSARSPDVCRAFKDCRPALSLADLQPIAASKLRRIGRTAR